VSDPIYSHARLAPIYDSFDAERHDLDAYVALAAELGSRYVIDLGCGTGCLALRLAAAGHRVIAVDPAAASMQVARAKSGSEQVTWLEGDATAIPPGADADLVVMTGNAAQAILTDEDWHTTLRRTYAALVPGGCFAFETRRPERRAWEEWDNPPPLTADIPGVGQVDQHLQLTEVNLPLVSFRFAYHFRADETTIVSESTIRFRSQREIEMSLQQEGFTIRDVREAPDRLGRELVFITYRK
jgi:ubiquinone/menaquinone biosynthesis C-methylase UbiE